MASKSDNSGKDPPGPLDAALGRARLAQAAHFDALIDLRDAQSLRLAALRDDIAPVLAGRPDASGLFSLALQPGDPPRLWLDMVSYVIMAPDPRTYRLVRDTRDGHETLFETTDRTEMIKSLTEFIAHRLVERERFLAGGAPARQETVQYGTTALVLAWLSGFSLGVLVLFAIGVWLAGGR